MATVTNAKRNAMGGTTYKKLAKEYDVYWSVIQKIVTRATWKHV